MASVQWLSLFKSLSTVIHSCAEYYLRWFLWHVGNTSAVIHQQNNDFISFFISDDIVAFTFMSSFPYLAWLSSATEQKHSKSQSFNFIKLFKMWLCHQKHKAGWRSRISSNWQNRLKAVPIIFFPLFCLLWTRFRFETKVYFQKNTHMKKSSITLNEW